MIDRQHDLPVSRQAELLKLSRASVYYRPKPVSDADLARMRRMDELHLEYPFAGSRMLRDMLNQEGDAVGRRRVARLMRRMGIEALYALVAPDLFDGPNRLTQGDMAQTVSSLPEALLRDGLRVLDSAASTAFVLALAGGALGFALLVWRRQRAE